MGKNYSDNWHSIKNTKDLTTKQMFDISAKLVSVDFAVALSSPDSFFDLFDITSEQTVELKWLMLNKHERLFHSSRVKFPLVSMSASWFLVSMYLIWIFWVQIDSIEGNMSHCGTYSFNDHLDHCFIVLKHTQQNFLMRKFDI